MKEKAVRNGDAVAPLGERVLISFATNEFGWIAARPQLSETGQAQLKTLLMKHLASHEVCGALSTLRIGVSGAVEAAIVERRAALDAESSKEAKKPSSKIGPRFRSLIDAAIEELEIGDLPPETICASILREPELARLVDIHLEERMRPLIADPLQRAPRAASKHLLEVLLFLRQAIHSGVTSGTVEAAHDMLARSVVSALPRANGRAPRRNFDAINGKESGYGLECCKILARELNHALPADLRRDKPLQMAKAWRRATEEADQAN